MSLKTQARQMWSARSASGKHPVHGQWASALHAAFLYCLLLIRPLPATEPALKDQPHVRWPVGSATLDDVTLVANRCGTVSIVNIEANRVVDEVRIGDRLVAIAAYPRGHVWLAIDEGREELIELARDGSSLRTTKRHSVPGTPVAVTVSAAGLVGVASLWSRTVTIFGPASGQEARGAALERKTRVTLSFNPGEISFDENRIVRRIGDPPKPLTPQQLDYQEKFSRFIVNDAFSPLVATVEPRAPFTVIHAFERPPWSVTYGSLFDKSLPEYKDGVESYKSFAFKVALGPAGELTPALRGELLFAGDTFGSRSCSRCHWRAHTTYELADTFSDGTTGTPKRIPTLLGTRLTDPWAWNGSFRDLSEQIRSSLENTMHVTNFTDEQVADLAAYLHTLPPPPPLEPATDDPADQAKLARGKALFSDLGCANCHIPPLTYTSPDTYDVGLEDEKGLRKFNPPSLRGVSQGYSFFHDGRAKTLEEVFTVHGHQLDRELKKSELDDLLRFLRSL